MFADTRPSLSGLGRGLFVSHLPTKIVPPTKILFPKMLSMGDQAIWYLSEVYKNIEQC
jgi:hypothetical protein